LRSLEVALVFVVLVRASCDKGHGALLLKAWRACIVVLQDGGGQPVAQASVHCCQVSHLLRAS
jgi:hypothetical protein